MHLGIQASKGASRRWYWWLWVPIGLVSSSCLRDLEGRPCPCQVGYTCCEGRCQASVTCDEKAFEPVPTCGLECTSAVDAAYSETVFDGSVFPATAGYDATIGAAESSNGPEGASTARDAALVSGETSPDADTISGASTESTSEESTSDGSTDHAVSVDNCGDGVIQTDEACDDGNRISGDGCSASCQVSRLAVGPYHVCVVSSSGRLRCWGRNTRGQLGLGDVMPRGTTLDSSFERLTTLDVGARTTLGVGAGGDHTCALFNDDAVGCWGNNDSGQLGTDDVIARGDDPAETGASLETVALPSLRSSPPTHVVGTGSSTCILDAAKKVWCFGYGRYLGRDQDNVGDTPGEMAAVMPVDFGDFEVQGLFGGGSHHCVISTAGDVKCWGSNQYGQLGLPDRIDRGVSSDEMGDELPRVDLGAGRVASELALGNAHTCALLDDGSVKCWGENQAGQLGLGVNDRWIVNVDLPVLDLGTGRTATAVAAGGSHTCVLLDNNQVKCFGVLNEQHPVYGVKVGDEYFEVGDGVAASNFGSSRRVLELGVGYAYACARLEGEVLRCWGRNSEGQLGLGDASISTELVSEHPEVLRDLPLEF